MSRTFSGSSGPSVHKQELSDRSTITNYKLGPRYDHRRDAAIQSRGKTMKKVQSFLAAALVLVISLSFTTIQTQGQVLYGSIVGTVTDDSGAVVPGAVIRLTNEGTSQ